MSLRFCFGPSGSGKSHRIYEEIMQRAAEEPGRNFLIIVPDQFTISLVEYTRHSFIQKKSALSSS